VWIGFIWLRMGTGDGFLYNRVIYFLVPYKAGDFLDHVSALLLLLLLAFLEGACYMEFYVYSIYILCRL
jgi:hypothetical protein